MEITTYTKKARQYLKENKHPLVILYATWGIFMLVMWPQMLFFNSSGDLTAGFRNIWGDWAMHISQVQSFTHQPFTYVLKNHPLYSGIPLTYPFVVNYISALFHKVGLSIVQSMIIPSIIISQILILNLYIFGKIFLGSAKKTLLAITLFFTSGGLGFIYYIKDLQERFTLDRVLYPPQEYTHMKPIGYWWTNTFTAHLIPQRAFLLGMAYALPLLTILYFYFKKDFKKVKTKNMIILGMFTGLLAYIHTHTLLLFFLLCLFLMLQSGKHLKYWINYALGTFITAIPFFLIMKSSGTDHNLTYLPGWLANVKELNMPVWLFWIKNWGLIIPLFIAVYITQLKNITVNKYLRSILNIKTTPNIQHVKFLSAFILMFITANLIRFQPSTWDNAKIFLWIYLIFSFTITHLIAQLFKQNLIKRTFAYFFIMVLVFSGSLDLLRLIQASRHSWVMVDKTHLQLGQQLMEMTQPTDLLLTSDDHLNWVTLTTGNPIVLGYRGWIWSHGIDYSTKENDIRSIYQGKPNALQLIKQYNIDYIVVDGKTYSQYQSNDAFFHKNFDLLISTPDERIYKVN